MRRNPAKPRSRPRRTPTPARPTVRQNRLCKPGADLLQEAPPDKQLRQAEWERVLQLRTGQLNPEVCAALQRRRDVYTRQTLNELDRVLGLAEVSHAGN